MSAPIWFFGTGNFAAACLREISKEYPPSLVVTAPPSVAGRGMKSKISPVEETAVELNLLAYRSPSINKDSDLLSQLEEKTPALILVIDFGQKVKEPYLNAPPCGCINIHPSLLPHYRGAAPVQRALMDGVLSTGVSLFRLVEQMDAGPIWIQSQTEIGENETAGELLNRLAIEGSIILKERVKYLLEGKVAFVPQSEKEATIAPRIEKSEARLDAVLSSKVLHNKVRALSPAPGAYVMFRGKRVKILKTCRNDQSSEGAGVLNCLSGKVLLGTSSGCLELKTVQPEGKKPMDALDWLKGIRLEKGEKIDD